MEWSSIFTGWNEWHILGAVRRLACLKWGFVLRGSRRCCWEQEVELWVVFFKDCCSDLSIPYALKM